MAKTNKVKLALSFIEADIKTTNDQIVYSVNTGSYCEAGKLQGYIEGLKKAASYLEVIDRKKETITCWQEKKEGVMHELCNQLI